VNFEVGDAVVYPAQGAGTVLDVETRDVLGERHTYLKIGFVRGGMEMLVPLAKVADVGLRPAVGASELDRLEDVLVHEEVRLPNAWPPRHRAEQEILDGGDAYALARLVGTLTRRDREKGLASTERDLLEAAKARLTGEFAVVSGASLDDAAARLDAALARREA